MTRPKTEAILQTPLAGAGPIVRQLDNGLAVLLEPLPYLRSVSTGVWIKTGSADEDPRCAGISHFLEHLLFKGTTTRSAHDLVERIEGRGGQINAFTSRDYTCLYTKTLDTHVSSAVEILGDIIGHSQFFDFDKEKNVILEEIASIEDSPEEYAHDLMMRSLWPEDSIGSPIAGDAETVGSITIDDVRGYFAARYRPENMIVAVAGRFDPEAVFDQIAAHFGGLTKGFQASGAVPPIVASGVTVYERDIAQHHLCLAFEGPVAKDKRRFIHTMLSSALGGGSTSRLFERIREQEGLAYTIHAYSTNYIRAGMLGVYAAVTTENCARALELVGQELCKLRDEPLPNDELESNREQLKGGLLMSLESTFNRMARLAKSTILYGRIPDVDEIVAAIDSVTAEEVQSCAAELFVPENPLLVVLGPEIELADGVLGL